MIKFLFVIVFIADGDIQRDRFFFASYPQCVEAREHMIETSEKMLYWVFECQAIVPSWELKL